jgi:hypothetical protein
MRDPRVAEIPDLGLLNPTGEPPPRLALAQAQAAARLASGAFLRSSP